MGVRPVDPFLLLRICLADIRSNMFSTVPPAQPIVNLDLHESIAVSSGTWTYRRDVASRAQVEPNAQSPNTSPPPVYERTLLMPVPCLSQTEQDVRLDDLYAKLRIVGLAYTPLGQLKQLVGVVQRLRRGCDT